MKFSGPFLEKILKSSLVFIDFIILMLDKSFNWCSISQYVFPNLFDSTDDYKTR